MDNKFTFIDLFAGIGGFHVALSNHGGECVYASEIDKNAALVYQQNHKLAPFGDITKKEIKDKIPDNFDVLCAGFPCQPFSKGGHQKGFDDTRGTLFFDICEITQKHKPKILFLENVSNLVTHDKGNTYKVILKHLDELGYVFPHTPLILSADEFGVPMLRKRIYIPAIRKDLIKQRDFIENFDLSEYKTPVEPIDNYLDLDYKNDLSEYEEKILEMWNQFYQGIDLDVIGFPIWSEYFKYDGAMDFPKWKKDFILKNKALYERNKEFIDKWYKKWDNLEWVNPTHKKMEWQAGKQESIYDTLIQFRPSGVRVKRSDKFSTFVAMNHQQIIGKLKRKLTKDEAKLLLNFPKNFKLHENDNIAFKQLGNSVSVKVVSLIFEKIKGFL